MITPWTPPSWMKTGKNMYAVDAETHEDSLLIKKFYKSHANYLAQTLSNYSANGVNIYGLTMQNEPLCRVENYGGMIMYAEDQADYLGNYLY